MTAEQMPGLRVAGATLQVATVTNPLDDIPNTQQRVVLCGRFLNRDALDRLRRDATASPSAVRRASP